MLTSGTEGRPGDCCSRVMTSSRLDWTQDTSSLSTSAVSLNRRNAVIINKQVSSKAVTEEVCVV